MRLDKAVEKLKKELGYNGCRNCKRQIEPLRMCEWAERGGDGKLHFICPWWERREEKMATINIKDTTEPKLVKLVDLSEDSINQIAEAVVRKIKEQEQRQILDGVEIVRCEDCRHSEHWYGDKRRCFLWHETGIDVFKDDYCSYGKRREDVRITDNN